MAAEPKQPSAAESAVSPIVAFERADVSAPRVALLGAGILIIALAAVLFVAPPFLGLKEHRADVTPQRSPNAPAGLRQPPEPRLQALPEADLKGYTEGYERTLRTYSWIDRSKGIAAIPIDRAMRIASQRGIPRVPLDPSIQLSQPRQGTRVTGLEGKVAEPPQ